MSESQGQLDGTTPEPTLSELATRVARLWNLVATHDDTLDTLVEYVTGPNVGGPWFWARLSEEQRTKVLRDANDFVAWLDATYLTYVPKFQIPPCWWRHPDVREQLIALMVSHRAVYTKKAKAVSGDLVEWHERSLWPVMERLAAVGSSNRCVHDAHPTFASAARVSYVIEPELAQRINPPQPQSGELDVAWLEEQGEPS